MATAVNLELKQLRSGKCTTPVYIVKLRDILLGLEEALESVDGLEHLRTPDKINYLVKNLMRIQNMIGSTGRVGILGKRMIDLSVLLSIAMILVAQLLPL